LEFTWVLEKNKKRQARLAMRLERSVAQQKPQQLVKWPELLPGRLLVQQSCPALEPQLAQWLVALLAVFWVAYSVEGRQQEKPKERQEGTLLSPLTEGTLA
jgi:hypothetical protein